ncbi:MAG TPA: phospholipid carrier-dependent glycosyltransferase [Patescibacteria group bacterium]|nr:phospholipid carrier-dependent glycosyltransferase [Patescibacteria group bacterium]
MRKSNWLLIGIVALAALLRFWGISSVPESLYWDEVSQGYNAYSLLTTGGYDEHHEFLPVARFIAFGDYKAPVNIYLTVPSIRIFGKNTFAVRFPSALFGTLTVLFVYFLARELFWERKNALISLAAPFLLAISPWHIQLSRAAYEGNIATFFTVLGVYLFLLAKRKNPWILVASSISFTIGIYAFNAQRIFIPLLIILLTILYWKDFLKKEKVIPIIASCIVGLVLLVPFIQFLRTPESKLRFNEVSIFTYSAEDVVHESNAWIQEENNSTLAKIIHNRRVIFSLLYLRHYFDFFNPNFLFFTGDINPRFSMQDSGELFLFELPLILFGAFAIAKNKNKTTILLFGWFILAPVAAATAKETPHALRGEPYIPTYEMMGAYGIWYLSQLLSARKQILRFTWIGGIVIVVVSVAAFLNNYFVNFPKLYSYDWQYGYQQAIIATQKLQNQYDVISFTSYYGRPYIYLLWFGNIPSQTYWNIGSITHDVFGFYNVTAVGKYQFRSQLIESTDVGKKVLYVGAPGEIPLNFHIIQSIDFLNGKPDFILATR